MSSVQTEVPGAAALAAQQSETIRLLRDKANETAA